VQSPSPRCNSANGLSKTASPRKLVFADGRAYQRARNVLKISSLLQTETTPSLAPVGNSNRRSANSVDRVSKWSLIHLRGNSTTETMSKKIKGGLTRVRPARVRSLSSRKKDGVCHTLLQTITSRSSRCSWPGFSPVNPSFSIKHN